MLVIFGPFLVNPGQQNDKITGTEQTLRFIYLPSLNVLHPSHAPLR